MLMCSSGLGAFLCDQGKAGSCAEGLHAPRLLQFCHRFGIVFSCQDPKVTAIEVDVAMGYLTGAGTPSYPCIQCLKIMDLANCKGQHLQTKSLRPGPDGSGNILVPVMAHPCKTEILGGMKAFDYPHLKRDTRN